MTTFDFFSDPRSLITVSKMAASWCKMLALVSCLMTISISRGDDCAEAESELMRCMMNSQLDYSRLSDPSYQHELCIEAQKLLDCTDEAREECPTMALLNGNFSKSVAAMTTQIKAYCPEEPLDNCRNPSSDIVACAQILHGANQYNLCPSVAQYVPCVREIQARCEGHPILEAASLEASITSIQGMTASIC